VKGLLLFLAVSVVAALPAPAFGQYMVLEGYNIPPDSAAHGKSSSPISPATAAATSSSPTASIGTACG